QLEEAIDRVLAGPERRSRVMSEQEKRVVAYHEAGHALVAHVMPEGDSVHKVSIVSRGRALGLTWFLPEDRYTHSRAQLRAQIDDEVNALIEQAHDEALAILVAHRDTLDALAGALIERETVDDAALAELFKDMEKWQGQPSPDHASKGEPLEPVTLTPVPVS